MLKIITYYSETVFGNHLHACSHLPLTRNMIAFMIAHIKIADKFIRSFGESYSTKLRL